jgi:hypothetical protein
MTQVEFAGLGLVSVAAYHLIPAVMTGAIPTRWPFAPLRRNTKPDEFRITFGAFWIAGVIGLGLLLAAMLKRLGL